MRRRCFIRGLTAVLMAGLLAGAVGGSARAQTEPVPVLIPLDVEDPEDGSRWTGLRLAAEGGRAYLFLFCDSDNTNPRILFAHGSGIDDPTKPVGIRITIDEAEPFTHYFTVTNNSRAAMYFVRTAEMYRSRFGTAPPVFNAQTRAINPLYVAWTDNIYNQVTADLFFGEILDMRFTDAAGAEHAYRFNLVRLAENIGRLAGCYEAPQVY